MDQVKKNHPGTKIKLNRSQWSWAFYDWANSSFSTTIMAGFFPIFFKKYWSQGVDATTTTARLGTVISISSLIIAILSPTLGTLSDQQSSKKFFLGFFMFVGVCASVWMGFIPEGDWSSAALAYGIGLCALTGSCNFYDSLLPTLATGKQMDYVSSFGYALGYLGGGLLFVINVLMFQMPSVFGIPDAVTAIKYSFISVGVWWFLFSIPIFFYVQEKPAKIKLDLIPLVRKSFAELKNTVVHFSKDKNIFLFLVSYWLYIDGVYTVMTMAVDFGLSIDLKAEDLIKALLITQFVGFPSAWLFGAFARNRSSKLPIMICIFTYSVTVILAMKMQTATHFYLLAFVIGVVQGGVQSLSRSFFARMIPEEKSGEYFGFFNLIGKFASILGPQLVALEAYRTKDARSSMLILLVLFLIGAILLYYVPEPTRSQTETLAQN